MSGTETPIPNLNIPLLRDGEGEHNATVTQGLGPLAGLIGTWNSPAVNPLGYNVMPLPQITAPNHFILKDFHYYEEMTFSAIDGSAPNRGGTYSQNSFVLFYEQRVYFGEGPAQNQLVHAENGDWLHLITQAQDQGPYNTEGPIASPPAPNPIPPQNPSTSIVKQVSVPHGNSILAIGDSIVTQGDSLSIPEVSTLPTGMGVNPGFYMPFNSTGPADSNNSTNLMVNPNHILNVHNENLKSSGVNIVETTAFTVSTKNPGGAVTNINFEAKRAHVVNFNTTFWLSKLSNGSKQLQYSQTIEMTLMQNNVTYYHIDANTLSFVGMS